MYLIEYIIYINQMNICVNVLVYAYIGMGMNVYTCLYIYRYGHECIYMSMHI